MRQGMNLGADDFLTKPFSIDALLDAVQVRLQRREQVAQAAEKQLDTLRRNIAHALPHELRTPLSLMLGCSQMIVHDYAAQNPELADMMQMISNSASRLHRLTEKFWAFAETELLITDRDAAWRLREAETHNASEIVIMTAQTSAELSKRERDLMVQYTACSAHISDTHLTHITSEIVENAFKFSQPGTPVYVETWEENNAFVLRVSDSGRGMTAEQIRNIGAYMQFERHHYEQQGIGLGLIISRRLTELYGGEFVVESAPNYGTTVTVILPTAPASHSAWGRRSTAHPVMSSFQSGITQ
jgi:signal transduction histidine kinase